MTGTIPVVELQFADFLLIAGDEIFHKLAKWRYMHGGQLALPMVRAAADRRRRRRRGRTLAEPRGARRCTCPGSKSALPATPADAKGLLKTAIRDPNPVLFFEHKGMYRVKGPVPADPEFLVPFGEAAVRAARRAPHRGGHRADGRARARSRRGARRRGHRARGDRPPHPGPARHGDDRRARSSALAAPSSSTRPCAPPAPAPRSPPASRKRAFFALDAPVWRLGALDTSIPQDPDLEQLVIPSSDQIAAAARELVAI